MNRQEGSVLLLVTVVLLMLGGFMTALLSTTFAYQRTSLEGLDRELAFRNAESGVSYYIGRLSQDPFYFATYPAPHSPVTIGDGSFKVETSEPGPEENQWKVLINGTCRDVTYGLNAIISYRRISFPRGIVAGRGNPSDMAFDIRGKSSVFSYDPANGPPDPNNPGNETKNGVNGSLNLNGGSKIHGDVNATGTVTNDGTSEITGTLTENGEETPIDPIESLFDHLMTTSQASNDNAVLAGIFGAQWTPVADGQNYGNLIVTGGNYVVPSGTYRFRRLEVLNGATVTFDTSGGSSQIVYVGSGAGTGTLNDLILGNGSELLIDTGGTQNGLVTVLGLECDFAIGQNSIFGQCVNDPNNAGYSQIVSLGADNSSDVISVGSGAVAYGRLYAPGHDLQLSGNATWYGSAVVNSISILGSVAGAALFGIDMGLTGVYLTDPTCFEVFARWPATAGGGG